MLDLLDSLQQILVFRLFLITISRQLLIRWSKKEIWLSDCWKKKISVLKEDRRYAFAFGFHLDAV